MTLSLELLYKSETEKLLPVILFFAIHRVSKCPCLLITSSYILSALCLHASYLLIVWSCNPVSLTLSCWKHSTLCCKSSHFYSCMKYSSSMLVGQFWMTLGGWVAYIVGISKKKPKNIPLSDHLYRENDEDNFEEDGVYLTVWW